MRKTERILSAMLALILTLTMSMGGRYRPRTREARKSGRPSRAET